MTKEIKKKAHKFIKKYEIKKVDFNALCKVAEVKGYMVIEFNSAYNSQAVQTIIKNLKLETVAKSSRGFTYTDNNHRLIFVNEDLSEFEKTIVLSHELGHIECGHFSKACVIGNDVREEYEANEFSHYLMNLSKCDRFYIFISSHKVVSLIILLLIIAVITTAAIFIAGKCREGKYYGEYYITETGSKYHTEDCVYIKDKENAVRLTEKAFDSGMYDACSVCLP